MLKSTFLFALCVMTFALLTGCASRNGCCSAKAGDNLSIAVHAAAAKDCGCGECAAKGCKPCHGKNCYFCVSKGLTTNDCGCAACAPKGCANCGPGCDVCKFNLAPVDAAKQAGQ